LLDGKCSKDGDFDYDVDHEAYEDLVNTYAEIASEKSVRRMVLAIEHDFDEALATRIVHSVLGRMDIPRFDDSMREELKRLYGHTTRTGEERGI